MPRTQPIRKRLAGPNIPRIERLVTGLIGLALTGYGLRRERTTSGRLSLGLGAYAIERAITGSCPLYRALAMRDTVSAWRSGDLLATVGRSFGRVIDLDSVYAS